MIALWHSMSRISLILLSVGASARLCAAHTFFVTRLAISQSAPSLRLTYPPTTRLLAAETAVFAAPRGCCCDDACCCDSNRRSIRTARAALHCGL